MADVSNESLLNDPNFNEQQTTQPMFPNSRLMKITTDFSCNPGIFDDIFKKIKDLIPPTFEGAKLSVSKPLSNHFQVSHTMTLNNETNSGYRFGANYLGTQFYSQSEIYPILMGDMDPSGNANAQIIHQWNEKLRTRLLAQVQSFKMAAYQLGMDYRTQFTTTSLTLVNINLFNKSGIAVLQHLARVTKNLDVGAEFLYQASPMVPGGHIGMTSFITKYRGFDWFTGLKLSPAGVINLSYYHQKSKSPLQLGVEFESSLATKDTSATFSYQYDLAKANTTFRGMIDTNGLVTAVIEKRLSPLPFSFLLSSSLNHMKAAYRFGVGLIIG